MFSDFPCHLHPNSSLSYSHSVQAGLYNFWAGLYKPAQVCTLQVSSLVREREGGTDSPTFLVLQPLPRSCLYFDAHVTQEYSWVLRYKVLGHFYSVMNDPLLKKKKLGERKWLPLRLWWCWHHSPWGAIFNSLTLVISAPALLDYE